MVFIAAYILFASAFTLCIKWVQLREREDVTTVGMINYIVAFVVIAVTLACRGPLEWEPVAVACGSAMGCTYFVAFFFVTYCIRTVGAAATTVVSVLSMIVPILAGIVIWDESPNGWQVFGVGLALAALTLMGISPRSRTRPPCPSPSQAVKEDSSDPYVEPAVGWFSTVVLFVFFLLCGNNRLTQEAFKHLSQPEFRPLFLVAAFSVAALPSLGVLVTRQRPILRTELVLGVLLGITNLTQSFLILKALQYLDAFIVFPVASSGAVLFTTLVATLFLGERLTRKAWLGIGVACLALLLLYWVPDSPKPSPDFRTTIRYQPPVPDFPFHGPTISEVTQPP